MMPKKEEEGSYARVARVEGRVRLVACRSVSPVRLLHPYLSERAVCLMLSSYGGGMVQGDEVLVEVNCEEGARLLIGTQANSRVYRNDWDLPTSQVFRGRVGCGARVAYLPDPLVLHEGSRFRQVQDWEVKEGGALLLAEWFQCGRSDSGECFAYRRYEAEVSLRRGEELLLWEPFVSEPGDQAPRLEGRFGEMNLMLNVYGVGEEAQGVLQEALGALVEGQRAFTQVPALTEAPFRGGASELGSLVRLEDRPVSIFRSLGRTRRDFDGVWRALERELVTEEWLGEGVVLPTARQRGD